MAWSATRRRRWRKCLAVVLTLTAIPMMIALLASKQFVVKRYQVVANPGVLAPPGGYPLAAEISPAQAAAFGAQAIRLNRFQRKEINSTSPELEARMSARRRHLKSTCALYGLDTPGNDTLHKPNPWEFLVSHKYHLVWCNVFKAASTSWMYNFNLMAGYSPKMLQNSKLVQLALARKRYPRPSVRELEKAINDSVSFLIVRHPFERLLSAYRDKLEYSLPHTYHQRLGNEIVLKYRGALAHVASKTPSKQENKVVSGIRRNARRMKRCPTFAEFVAYLIDQQREGRAFDMHWAPVAEFCTPCQVHFDVILKFETLNKDQEYLLERAGLQGIVTPQWKNPGKGRTTGELIYDYYAQLTRSQIIQLYNIYRYDFELFGYTLDGFLDKKGDTSSGPAPVYT